MKYKKIVDPHFHLWNLTLNKHSWLIDEIENNHIGNYERIRNSYLLKNYLIDSKEHQIEGLVHIQAGWSRFDSISETRWLNQVDKNIKIVCYIDFLSDNYIQQIEEELTLDNIVGVRQILSYDENPYYRGCSIDYLNNATWQNNFNNIKNYNLTFDAQIYPEQIDNFILVVKVNTTTKFIISHFALSKFRTKEYFDYWHMQLKKIATYDNVYIKLSGFGMFEHNYSELSIKPYIMACLDTFGVARCMFASNFPVDKLYKSFDQVYEIYDNVIKDFSQTEKMKLFVDNAKSVYQL